MHEFSNDPVEVIVAFKKNKVQPLLMKWNGKDYKIERVNLIHAQREGLKRIFYFSVSDLSNYFKLRLDSETLEWRLVELSTE